MSVFVDILKDYPTEAIKPGARHAGHKWCHMWADTPEELHAMADKLGLKREWFQKHSLVPHYDLVPSKRAAAIRYGAIPKSLRDHLKEQRAATGKPLTRTWPYGTRLKAKILDIVAPRQGLKPSPMTVILESEDREGHILMGDCFDIAIAKGQAVIMQFTKGGPTGGYWRIVE